MRRLLLAFSVLLALAVPAHADGFASKTDVFASRAAFAHAETAGVRYDERAGGFRLEDDPAGGFRREGSFTLGELRYNSGFDTAVASWNADCPPGTWVRVELSASVDDGKSWSSWYELARWGDADAAHHDAHAGIKADPLGKVEVDTLKLKQEATRLRYRLTLASDRPAETPLVSLAAVTVADSHRPVAPDDTPGPAWGREVPAEWRSQAQLNADIAYRGCGPTSAAMALTAYGVSLPTSRVAEVCWDAADQEYGNWAFLAAGASSLLREVGERLPARLGRRRVFRSYVSWCPDWKDVEREVLAGNPVMVSIYFGQGELKGSQTPASEGHLVLVRGFTRHGDVICNDPAAHTPARGRIVYNRHELHRARHGGPVIVFEPYD